MSVAPERSPRLSIGPDRHVYLAMPARARPEGEPYDGMVLRFDPEGAAAGHEAAASPVLAFGMPLPGPLAWDTRARLWLTSLSGGPDEALSSLYLQWGASEWPILGRLVPSSAGAATGTGGVASLEFSLHGDGSSTAYFVAGAPGRLFIATIPAGDPASMTAVQAVPLGPFEPVTLTRGDDGTLLVAAKPTAASGAPTVVIRVPVTPLRTATRPLQNP